MKVFAWYGGRSFGVAKLNLTTHEPRNQPRGIPLSKRLSQIDVCTCQEITKLKNVLNAYHNS